MKIIFEIDIEDKLNSAFESYRIIRDSLCDEMVNGSIYFGDQEVEIQDYLEENDNPTPGKRTLQKCSFKVVKIK